MMLPPKAGRICTRSPFSRSSSWVQSAVRPVRSRVAVRGASDRPRGVAPTSTTAGERQPMASSSMLAYRSQIKCSSSCWGYCSTRSTP